MEDKKLLIVGIDPGITTAYAVLDIEGNLLHIKSSKQLDLNLIISEAIKIGKVVLVGTDKAKTPNLVEAFATKLGARVIIPPEDLKVDEKRKSINKFSFDDEHQGDALASALFAYREMKSLLDKIDFFAEKNKKQGIKNRIKELVITRKISIRSAVGIIEKKDEESGIIENVIAKKKLAENDFLRLYDKLKKYEAEIKIIKEYSSKLENRVKNLEKSLVGMEKQKVYDEDKKKTIDFRENRIKFLENLIRLKEKDIGQFKFLIKKYNNVISNINHFYILKRLETLGLNEFNFKNRILNIQRNDILFVDDPNIVSEGVVDLLKNKIFVIVCKKPVSKKLEERLPFIFISAKKLKIDEDKYFSFVEKRQFEMEKDKANWISKIVSDYKKEKEQLISG